MTIIGDIPACHQTAYFKQLEVIMKEFLDWAEDCPDTLQFDHLEKSVIFNKLKNRFLDLVYEAHVITRAAAPESTIHWEIEYQSQHLPAAHKQNRKQKLRLGEIKTLYASIQHEQAIMFRAKMAIKNNEKCELLRWTPPNGLDAPQLYFLDQHKIEQFMNMDQAHATMQTECLEKFKNEKIEQSKCPAAQIQVIVENVPSKKRRTDKDNMDMML